MSLKVTAAAIYSSPRKSKGPRSSLGRMMAHACSSRPMRRETGSCRHEKGPGGWPGRACRAGETRPQGPIPAGNR